MHPENPTITNQYIKLKSIFPKNYLNHYNGLFQSDSANLLCTAPFSTESETLLGVKMNTISLIF